MPRLHDNIAQPYAPARVASVFGSGLPTGAMPSAGFDR